MGLISDIKDKFSGANPAQNTGMDHATANTDSPPTPISASEGIIAGRKKRVDAGVSRGPRGEKLSASQTQMAQAFEELYKPKTWEGIVCAPADTMLAMSGRKIWIVSQPERDTISTHAALTARCFAIENPKWLALAMLGISIAHIYGARTILHLQERRSEKAEEARLKKLAGEKPA